MLPMYYSPAGYARRAIVRVLKIIARRFPGSLVIMKELIDVADEDARA